jgi:hypothetical protein
MLVQASAEAKKWKNNNKGELSINVRANAKLLGARLPPRILFEAPPKSSSRFTPAP